jgi:site-specific DNA-methyltransferase (adenine-specific)
MMDGQYSLDRVGEAVGVWITHLPIVPSVAGCDVEPYWQHERAALYGGDALAVLASLPDASVDAVITDPPYSSGGMMRGDRTQDVHTKYVRTDSESGHALQAFSGDTRDAFGYWFWCSVWLAELTRIVRPGGVCALFTDWRQLSATIGGIQSGGWVYRGVVPWFKPSGRYTQGRWANVCEYVVWGTNGPRALDYLGNIALPGFFQATAPTPTEREHITQKPLSVMRELVKIVPKGGVILDPFMGSGTTGVAAMTEGRDFIGAELAPHYQQVARERIEASIVGYRDDGKQLALA